MPSRSRPAPRRKTKAKKATEVVPLEPADLEVPEKFAPPSDLELQILQTMAEIHRRLPFSVVREVAQRLEDVKLSRKKLEEVLDRVADRFEGRGIDPNESCGIVSAQSIGEPGTQMSIPREERVLVRWRGHVRAVPIGDVVDDLMARFSVVREAHTEWCDLPPGAALEVPSLTPEGKVVWKPVRSVSRHRYPGQLIRVRTRSGREVTATPNHSFVTRRECTIVPVLGTDLKPGDMVPTLRRWATPANAFLSPTEFLPVEEYGYGSQLARAQALGPGWKGGYGGDFVVPVGMDALGRYLHGRNTLDIEDGFVYPFQSHGRPRIPEQLALDAPLGWLLGAYLSEGWAAKSYVNISNTDPAFMRRTKLATLGLGVAHGEFDNPRGYALGHDIHVRSTVLVTFLKASCGNLSGDKRVPDFALDAPDAFVGSLLRAYFEGDGNVAVDRGAIRASSSSPRLMEGIALLLARFGIFASVGHQGKQTTLWIPARYARAFRSSIGFESKAKRRRLDELCDRPASDHTQDALDMTTGFGDLLRDLAKQLGIPTRYVNNFTRRQRIGRSTLVRYLALFEARSREQNVDLQEDLGKLRTYLEEDVAWDEVEEVSWVESNGEPVYDFSVPGLETFTTAQGIVTHNTMRTFHYAGVAEMNVTLGLPRLIEIVDARRVPSTPIMEVHLREDKKLDTIKGYASQIEVTTLADVADVETDIINMRAVAYPNENRMRSKGITYDDLDKALKKLKKETLTRAKADGSAEKVDGYVMESDQPSFKRLQRMVEVLRDTKIKGIEGIKRAIIRKRGDGYVIYTEGSNLQAILDLLYVDPTKTTTNNIMEIYEVLGIEAARNAIIKEASDTLGEQGLTVDIRHIMLVSDIMTNDGDVKAIGRHGISGRKSSVLARAAFEITAHHLLRAAVSGEVDYLDGVAENVIVGQPVTLGTGAVNLVFTPSKRPAAAAGVAAEGK